jgi:hypothetical protein
MNETEIWNSLLGKACADAEQEVAAIYRALALSKVSALTDLDSVLRFDVVATRNEMFIQARNEFRQKCTDQRADLLRLVPHITEEAEHRLREMIEDRLRIHRSQLLHIFEAKRDIIRAAATEAGEAIDVLSDDAVQEFALVWRREELYQALVARFMDMAVKMQKHLATSENAFRNPKGPF